MKRILKFLHISVDLGPSFLKFILKFHLLFLLFVAVVCIITNHALASTEHKLMHHLVGLFILLGVISSLLCATKGQRA